MPAIQDTPTRTATPPGSAMGVAVRVEPELRRVARAADRGNYRNIGHAAASIRKDMAASIERSPEPSTEGSPPHTRKGQLRRALRYAVERGTTSAGDRAAVSAVVGAMESVVGESAAAHEHGETYKGTDFPARPFANPSLERNLDRFADDWSGSIGE